MRRFALLVILVLLAIFIVTAIVGNSMAANFLHPMHLNSNRVEETANVLAHTGATKQDFTVRAPDGVELHGWKVFPAKPNGDWVLLFHGVCDNRTGTLSYAAFLLRHGYSLVMMDSRVHGETGGDIATYGWKY